MTNFAGFAINGPVDGRVSTTMVRAGLPSIRHGRVSPVIYAEEMADVVTVRDLRNHGGEVLR